MRRARASGDGGDDAGAAVRPPFQSFFTRWLTFSFVTQYASALLPLAAIAAVCLALGRSSSRRDRMLTRPRVPWRQPGRRAAGAAGGGDHPAHARRRPPSMSTSKGFLIVGTSVAPSNFKFKHTICRIWRLTLQSAVAIGGSAQEEAGFHLLCLAFTNID